MGLKQNTWMLDEWYAQEYASPATYEGAKQLWTWGLNDNGQLGLNQGGSPTSRSSPCQVGSLETWKSLSYGMGVTSNGNCYVWGAADGGRLGLNKSHPSPALRRSSPTQLPGTWSTGAGAICCRGSGAMGVKADGTLWNWGSGHMGRLGINISTPGNGGRSSPCQIPGSDWSDEYQSTATFTTGAAAIKTDGTLWIWGDNEYGSLGQNNTTDQSSPVQVGSGTDWKTVSGSYRAIAATKTDGSLYTWGQNQYGHLGQNNQTQYESPKQVPGSWSYATMGYKYMHGVKTDGTLWGWGQNANGVIGNNQSQTSPSGGGLKAKSSPVQIGTNTTWKKPLMQMANQGAGAIKTDGTLWLWGDNEYGPLGQNENNNPAHRSSPVQIPGIWDTANSLNETTSALKLL